jgi:hypothetical protein
MTPRATSSCLPITLAKTKIKNHQKEQAQMTVILSFNLDSTHSNFKKTGLNHFNILTTKYQKIEEKLKSNLI